MLKYSAYLEVTASSRDYEHFDVKTKTNLQTLFKDKRKWDHFLNDVNEHETAKNGLQW